MQIQTKAFMTSTRLGVFLFLTVWLCAVKIIAGSVEPANEFLPIFNQNHQCVASGSNLYVIGGYHPLVFHSIADESGKLSKWKEISKIPAQYGYNYCAATVYGERIYVLGGHAVDRATNQSKRMASVIYAKINADGSLGAWTETTPLPEPPLGGGVALVVGGRLYHIGGGNKAFFAPVEKDGAIGKWSETSPLESIRWGFLAFEYKGALYAVGGANAANQPIDSVIMAKIKADGQLARWRRTEPLPDTMGNFAGARIGDRILIFGGQRNGNTRLVGYLDPTGGVTEWKTLPVLPFQASGLAGAVVNDKWIYLTGGSWTTDRGAIITRKEVYVVSVQE